MTNAGGVDQDARLHPLTRFAARLDELLDEVADAGAWSMTAVEEREVLRRLSASAARVSEVYLRVLAAADQDDVGKVDGSPSTAAWLAAATRRSHSEARADVRLASALDQDFATTRRALADGRADVGHARSIVAAVEALPVRPGVDDRRLAEQHLVDLAGRHDARELRVLGRRVLEVVDPDAADEELGRQLVREEREARRNTYLRMQEWDDGTTTGVFRVPTLHAHMLRKALDAFTSPRRLGPEARRRADGTPLARADLLGRGLCELIERFPVSRLPTARGVNATVVVTISLEKLRADLAAASLDTGGLLSAGEARRLACEAGIIPVVLDGRSVPVDLGREQRLFSRYQRIALGVGHQTCAEEHCDRPAAWAEAHHRRRWSVGGSTSIENGELLCSWHHHRAHDPGYALTRHPGGAVRFHRRT
jgi:hypothetical protein